MTLFDRVKNFACAAAATVAVAGALCLGGYFGKSLYDAESKRLAHNDNLAKIVRYDPVSYKAGQGDHWSSISDRYAECYSKNSSASDPKLWLDAFAIYNSERFNLVGKANGPTAREALARHYSTEFVSDGHLSIHIGNHLNDLESGDVVNLPFPSLTYSTNPDPEDPFSINFDDRALRENADKLIFVLGYYTGSQPTGIYMSDLASISMRTHNRLSLEELEKIVKQKAFDEDKERANWKMLKGE